MEWESIECVGGFCYIKELSAPVEMYHTGSPTRPSGNTQAASISESVQNGFTREVLQSPLAQAARVLVQPGILAKKQVDSVPDPMLAGAIVGFFSVDQRPTPVFRRISLANL